MFGKVVEIGSVLWSLPRMGSNLGTGKNHTRFYGGLPLRGVEKIWENLKILSYWIFCEFPLGMDLRILWYWRVYSKRDGRIRIRYICKILTISLYVPENLWTRFWIALEGEMLLAEWIKVWVVQEIPPGIFSLIFGSKQETSIVLSCSEQVKIKKWTLDTSHAFVELLAERIMNIAENFD